VKRSKEFVSAVKMKHSKVVLEGGRGAEILVGI